MVEGAPHTAKRSMINLCVYGVPPPPYIKEWRRGEGRPSMARPGGVLLPPGVGFPPPFPSWNRIREGERGEREGRGAPPPSPCPIRTRGGGARGPALATSPLFH